MATSKLLVFTNPTDGQEDAYNDWYNNVHLAEVCQKVPSVKSAQRFKLAGGFPGVELAWKYLAIYEVDNDDPTAVLAELAEHAPNMQMTTAMDRSAGVWSFEPVSGVVTD